MFKDGYFRTDEQQAYTKNPIYIRSIVETFREENPIVAQIFMITDFIEVLKKLNKYVATRISKMTLNSPEEIYTDQNWKNIGLYRLRTYLKNEGKEFITTDENHIVSEPIYLFWRAIAFEDYIADRDFFIDWLFLFRQINGSIRIPHSSDQRIKEWMSRHYTGLDQEIIELRGKNKNRIIQVLLNKIENKELRAGKYKFEDDWPQEKKLQMMHEWWNSRMFHLQFAIRTPEILNEMMDYSLNEYELSLLHEARKKGIPLFVNPYYLSLLLINPPDHLRNQDRTIRDYIFVSEQLVNEFGKIKAWEKEDIVKPGEPNAAGWILPNEFNIHRRYPEVAIFIPKTVGRACGGLCVSCQRMYDFQRGHLNFDLSKLKAKQSWWDEMPRLFKYFEEDTQLRDILVTGGDALMSSDNALRRTLDEIFTIAKNKRDANISRPDGEKFAEILRVRLGTRLLAYIPQRITRDLAHILASFREKASKIGIKQFIIQTHFETALEVTPEVQKAVLRIQKAGWIITNQLVFIPSASKRGHTAKLRQVLNDIGILTYYTFSVKGYRENAHNFSPNARSVQEIIEEKAAGKITSDMLEEIRDLQTNAIEITQQIQSLKSKYNIPFLATDRNLMNLPAVGKSLTFNTIGISRSGQRLLEFDHDPHRNHSPIIKKMGKIRILESKSVGEYLRQQHDYGENPKEYQSIWGYSIGVTEKRMPIFEYPDYPFEVSSKITNLNIDN